jgi:hypothetical protein
MLRSATRARAVQASGSLIAGRTEWLAALGSRVLFSPTSYLGGLAVAVTLIAIPSSFIPHPHPSTGEVYESYVAGRSILHFGWGWAGLQDEATSNVLKGQPFLYIHHGSARHTPGILRRAGVG